MGRWSFTVLTTVKSTPRKGATAFNNIVKLLLKRVFDKIGLEVASAIVGNAFTSLPEISCATVIVTVQ